MKKASDRPAKPKVRKAAHKMRAASPAAASRRNADEMRPEYDFRGGVRGKYASRFATGRPVRVVVLAPDVAEAFGSTRAVNAALRRVLKERGRADDAGRRSERTT